MKRSYGPDLAERKGWERRTFRFAKSIYLLRKFDIFTFVNSIFLLRKIDITALTCGCGGNGGIGGKGGSGAVFVNLQQKGKGDLLFLL